MRAASSGERHPNAMAEHKPPPENIGRYRVEKRLGRGGMGEVYRGHDPHLDRPVALKRILPEEAQHEIAIRRFRREARAAARVSHSAIVQLFDWLEEGDSDWIVMEWVAGPTLRDLVKQGGLPWAIAARLARDIAAGLAVAHGAGIIHRDLKSTNVMLTEHDEIKIMDFGLAKQIGVSEHTPLSAVSELGIVIGTVTAMSPEQAQGRMVEYRSDLFSLGSLLYELLTGVKPFRAESAVKVLIRICTVDPPRVHTLVPDIPEALSALVAQLLDKDPDRRPSSAREVAAALEEFAAPQSAMDGLSRSLHQGRAANGTEVGTGAGTGADASAQAVHDTERAPASLAESARSRSDGVDLSHDSQGNLDPRLAVTAGLTLTGYANEWTKPTSISQPAAEQEPSRPTDASESQDDSVP